VRFAFIEEHRAAYPVEMMCQLLEVSRSGYYAWSARQDCQPCRRDQRRAELIEKILVVHAQSRETYGSPRVYQELKALGEEVCQNTVAKLMKEQGVRSIVRRRFRVRTTDSAHAHPTAPNLLERCFERELPNQAWCADITYIPTGEGWLYLSAVIDLCSRKIVGWSMADHLRAELCQDALGMALTQRRPEAGLLHHSDRGVQYACGDYRRMLEEKGLECSMSRRGDCWDNAVMESFFKTLKTELVYHRKFATRAEATGAIFEYIEVFYNRKRRHSSLGYVSPEEYETSLN
jgi:transposase InsO family protein